MMTKIKIAKMNVNSAIRELWLKLRDLTDFGVEAISEEDLDLMTAISGHSAIQDRLKENINETRT